MATMITEEETLFEGESLHQHEHTSTFNDRGLATASDMYWEVSFMTDSIYNEPAPEPYVAFALGAVFSIVGFVMWLRRLRALKQMLSKDEKWKGTVWIRAMISVAIDADEPFYTIVSYAAPSFLFLGGLQLDYMKTFAVMLGTYGITSILEPIRILLAWRESNSLADVTFASAQTRVDVATATTLNPTNVYEDLARGATIVLMVFLTQCILITFVVIDVFRSDTHSCMDGTPNCPVVGTFGSWGQYVLGIFMANVFLLGPKTSFGQSEQNPSYWLQLLLSAKRAGSQFSWYDPIHDTTRTQQLSTNDFRIWIRLAMSTLINGVGFHVLVHALPIQIASQSSLLGIVFRAVGMMYLVDLDDTAGYRLTVIENHTQQEEDEKPDGAPPMMTIEEDMPLVEDNMVVEMNNNNTKLDEDNDEDVEEQQQPPSSTTTTAVTPSNTAMLMTGAGGAGGATSVAALQSMETKSEAFSRSDSMGTGGGGGSSVLLSEEQAAFEVQRILADARAQIDALGRGVILPGGGTVGTAGTANGMSSSFRTNGSNSSLLRRRRNPTDVKGSSRRPVGSIGSHMLIMCGSKKGSKFFRMASSDVSGFSATTPSSQQQLQQQEIPSSTTAEETPMNSPVAPTNGTTAATTTSAQEPTTVGANTNGNAPAAPGAGANGQVAAATENPTPHGTD